MTARAVITAVMAEASVDVEGLTWDVGSREGTAQHAPPRVVWIPQQGTHRGPQQSGYNPRPIANRWVRYAVRCWGEDYDAAEAIMAAVVRGLHLALTRGGYELGGEDWAQTGVASAGEAVTLTVSLGIPITDRPQPTARATTIATPGDLTP